MTAASAVPTASAATERRQPGQRPVAAQLRHGQDPHPKNSAVKTMRWKLDVGWPAKNCAPTSADIAAKGSGPGDRMHSSAASATQGTSAQTLMVVQGTQVTAHRLKP